MERKQATLALIVKDGKVLLGRKIRAGADIGEGTLNGPGGKVEPGQSLIECLTTETRDEVGIVPDALSPHVATLEFHNGSKSIWDVYVYLVTSFSGEPHDTEEMVAVDGVWWYPFSELPFTRMLASDSLWLPRLLAGERFKMSVFQNDDASVLAQEPVFSPLD